MPTSYSMVVKQKRNKTFRVLISISIAIAFSDDSICLGYNPSGFGTSYQNLSASQKKKTRLEKKEESKALLRPATR